MRKKSEQYRFTLTLRREFPQIVDDLLMANMHPVKRAYCHNCIGSAWKIINGIILGKVVCNNIIYYTKTEMLEENIHTIAVTRMEDFDAVQHFENTSTIQKTNEIPNWFDTEKSVLKPVSISHHGRFTRMIRFT